MPERRCTWPVPCAGARSGAQVPPAWSLDFVVTLTFLVLLVPALRSRADLAAGRFVQESPEAHLARIKSTA